jgi:hypothetical protein
MTQQLTLAQFYHQLKKADWFFSASDEARVYNIGLAALDKLQMTATDAGPQYLWLFKCFRESMYSGDPWKTTKIDLPPAPTEPSMNDLIDLRAQYEKEHMQILADRAVAKVLRVEGRKLGHIPPAVRHGEVLHKVTWMAFFSEKGSDCPSLFKRDPGLSAAWQAGLAQGTDYDPKRACQ